MFNALEIVAACYKDDVDKVGNPALLRLNSQKAHDFSRGMNGVHLYNQPLCI